MPLYNTKCLACGNTTQLIFRKIAERDNLPSCDSCNGALERVLVAPMVIGEFEPYVSPGTGRIISSRAQRADDLRRAGAFLYEPGVKEDIARNKVASEEKAFASVAAAIDDQVRSLVNSGKIES